MAFGEWVTGTLRRRVAHLMRKTWPYTQTKMDLHLPVAKWRAYYHFGICTKV
ncbi:MAG: hypothetical protein H6636_14645 [Anaerolineales bacterium]|nr:hypothetical protein [Anaerolineales bacterium]